jgi:tRNA (mo5U34)-methyltransferase
MTAANLNPLPDDFTALEQWFRELSPKTATQMSELLQQIWETANHGHLQKWQSALSQLRKLPLPTMMQTTKSVVCAANAADCDAASEEQIIDLLQEFMPWRKGPWQYCGIDIDTEWRSDMKWDRLVNKVDLQGKNVLDVGCGSGYHSLRMFGAGAASVLGIDPTWLFVYQFQVFKQCFPEVPVWVQPLAMESLNLPASFDTVFSMGVLYHRRDPIAHLQELKASLKSGGELILETLIVEGDAQTILVPQDRYAAMRNVWFIPSIDALLVWLERLKFKHIRVLDVTQTTKHEQRKTAWIHGDLSLEDFLDKENSQLTIEGHPAPNRVIISAIV